MKSSDPISAYAVYKKSLKSDKNVHKEKSRMKTKLNLVTLKAKDIKRKEKSVNGLNSKKIILGLHEAVQSDSYVNMLKKNSDIHAKLPNKKSHTNKSEKCNTSVQSHRINKNATIPETGKTTTENIHNTKINQDVSINSINSTVVEGLKLFEWLISPTSINVFLDEYWEKKHMVVSRSNTKYYKHIFSSKCLDKMFRINNLHYTRNVDVVVYENGKKELLNPEGKVVPAAIWDFYNNGCSIRVLNPQSYNKKLHFLVSTLQEYFGSMVGVNVYLTPPNSQGFAPHFDDIEAFIIQLEGKKHWKLYHPRKNDVLARYSSNNFTQEEIGDPFFEVTLKKGSLLYFPRGTIHEGRTDQDSHSLHLTVSVYQNNAYVDLLEKILPNALIRAAQSDIEFRKGLPLHFLRNVNPLDSGHEPKRDILKNVSSLMDKLKTYIDIDEGIMEIGRKLVYDSMPPVLNKEDAALSSKQGGDMLIDGKIYNKIEFDLSTQIRLTRFHCVQPVYKPNMETFNLYYSTENANVYHGEEEQFLVLEKNMLGAIELLRDTFPAFIEIDNLPIENQEDRVQFAYDLWERGIVLTSTPSCQNSDILS